MPVLYFFFFWKYPVTNHDRNIELVIKMRFSVKEKKIWDKYK